MDYLPTFEAFDIHVGFDCGMPMCIFTGIATVSLIVAIMLKKADKKYGYGLEKANLQKKNK